MNIGAGVLENTIKYLHNISTHMDIDHPTAKSYFASKSRILETRGDLYLPSKVTKTTVRCPRCCLSFLDYPPRIVLKPKRMNRSSKKMSVDSRIMCKICQKCGNECNIIINMKSQSREVDVKTSKILLTDKLKKQKNIPEISSSTKAHEENNKTKSETNSTGIQLPGLLNKKKKKKKTEKVLTKINTINESNIVIDLYSPAKKKQVSNMLDKTENKITPVIDLSEISKTKSPTRKKNKLKTKTEQSKLPDSNTKNINNNSVGKPPTAMAKIINKRNKKQKKKATKNLTSLLKTPNKTKDRLKTFLQDL